MGAGRCELAGLGHYYGPGNTYTRPSAAAGLAKCSADRGEEDGVKGRSRAAKRPVRWGELQEPRRVYRPSRGYGDDDDGDEAVKSCQASGICLHRSVPVGRDLARCVFLSLFRPLPSSSRYPAADRSSGMGNLMSCGVPIRVSDTASTAGAVHTVKLVHPDGGIEELLAPLSVAELMLEHPRYFICEMRDEEEENSSSGGGGGGGYRRPLPADHQLAAGQVYCLLPRTLLLGRHSGPLKQPHHQGLIGVTRKNDGVTRLTISKGLVDQLMGNNAKLQQQHSEQQSPSRDDDGDEDEDDDGELERMAFSMKLMSRCTSWRPKLATIDESIY